MRERGRKNRTSATMLAGWKKAVVLMLAFIMCISSIVVPQLEEVSAKAANRIDFKINGKTGSKVTLYAGEYIKFTIDGMWQNGQYIQTQGTTHCGDKVNFKPSKELTYKSSNNAVATVTNKGVITAKKKGTCKIMVTSIYNAKVKGTIKVTVSKKKQNAKITLEKKKATIAVGKTATVKVKSYKGISRKGVKFASSNKKVATVSSKGKVTAKKAGTATITVTSVVNKKAVAKFKVTVKNPDTINTNYTPSGKKKIVLDETSVTLAPESSFDKMPRAVDGMPDAVFDAGEIAAYARTDIADPDMGRKYYVVCAKMLVSNKKKYGASIFTDRQGSICLAPINCSWADETTLQRLPVRQPGHNRPLPAPANRRPVRHDTTRFPKQSGWYIVLQRPVLPVPAGNGRLPAPASQKPVRRNTTHIPKRPG